MTLNGVIAFILRYLANSVAFGAHYVKVVDPATYSLPRSVIQYTKHDRRAVLFAVAELLVCPVVVR